jgi:integrase
MITRLKVVASNPKKRTVANKGRLSNRELRTREHLTPSEVEKLIEAAKGNRQGHRDSTMILLAYRHGLRAPELVDLRWDQVDFNQGVLHVRRAKNGTPATHPLTGKELRAPTTRSRASRNSR